PQAAITETPRRTSSPASTGSRSVWFSAQRYSIAMFSPSTKPASLRPWRNARSASANGSADWALRNPTTGITSCCARAASGHAAAPPSSVMNSRRLRARMGSPHPVQPASRTPRLARRDWLVLGATLNRSEIEGWACPHELSRLIALDEVRIVLALVTADLDQNRRLEVEPALMIVLNAIAVLLRREPSSGPFTRIDTQSRALDVLVINDRLAVAGRDVVAARVVRNFDDFPEGLVGLRLSGVRIPLKKVPVFPEPSIDRLLRWLITPSADFCHRLAFGYTRTELVCPFGAVLSGPSYSGWHLRSCWHISPTSILAEAAF